MSTSWNEGKHSSLTRLRRNHSNIRTNFCTINEPSSSSSSSFFYWICFFYFYDRKIIVNSFQSLRADKFLPQLQLLRLFLSLSFLHIFKQHTHRLVGVEVFLSFSPLSLPPSRCVEPPLLFYSHAQPRASAKLCNKMSYEFLTKHFVSRFTIIYKSNILKHTL